MQKDFFQQAKLVIYLLSLAILIYIKINQFYLIKLKVKKVWARAQRVQPETIQCCTRTVSADFHGTTLSASHVRCPRPIKCPSLFVVIRTCPLILKIVRDIFLCPGQSNFFYYLVLHEEKTTDIYKKNRFFILSVLRIVAEIIENQSRNTNSN